MDHRMEERGKSKEDNAMGACFQITAETRSLCAFKHVAVGFRVCKHCVL
jgi:hypothetical protein